LGFSLTLLKNALIPCSSADVHRFPDLPARRRLAAAAELNSNVCTAALVPARAACRDHARRDLDQQIVKAGISPAFFQSCSPEKPQS